MDAPKRFETGLKLFETGLKLFETVRKKLYLLILHLYGN